LLADSEPFDSLPLLPRLPSLPLLESDFFDPLLLPLPLRLPLLLLRDPFRDEPCSDDFTPDEPLPRLFRVDPEPRPLLLPLLPLLALLSDDFPLLLLPLLDWSDDDPLFDELAPLSLDPLFEDDPLLESLWSLSARLSLS
jgi:hypothetical protein